PRRGEDSRCRARENLPWPISGPRRSSTSRSLALRALGRDDFFDVGADPQELRGIVRLEAHHEHWAGVRRTHEAPRAVAERDARAVRVVDVVAALAKRFGHALHDVELDVVGAVDA